MRTLILGCGWLLALGGVASASPVLMHNNLFLPGDMEPGQNFVNLDGFWVVAAPGASETISSLKLVFIQTGSAGPWTNAGAVGADLTNIRLFQSNTNVPLGPTVVPGGCAGEQFSANSYTCQIDLGPGFVVAAGTFYPIGIRADLPVTNDLTSIQITVSVGDSSATGPAIKFFGPRQAVPEPASLGLVGVVLVGLGIVRRVAAA